jgi:hypothetical protein
LKKLLIINNNIKKNKNLIFKNLKFKKKKIKKKNN